MSTDPASNSISPDLILLNALVRTMDSRRPTAEAIAIVGERIAALGKTGELRSLVGPKTKVIDAKGALALPGFNDAHLHFLMGGFSVSEVNLRPARSPAEMAELLRVHTLGNAKGAWLLGGNWDHENWPGAPLPTKALIDPVTGDNPTLVRRLDGHMSLANSLALKLAGISAATPNPPGGIIVKDARTGEPTGVLKDAAEDLVTRVIPEKTFAEKKAAALSATRYAASLGVTSVTDMSADADVAVYQELLSAHTLLTRVYPARSIISWETLTAKGMHRMSGGHMLRTGAVKGFADGSLGSSTALFFEPYADAPQNRGLLFEQMLPEGRMLERVRGADLAGLQVMIHAIGDEANARILDLYAQVSESNPARDRRFRIEHAQHLRRQDIPRFGRQKVIASVQPYHAADDGRWCEKRLGSARSRWAYPFRSLLNSGAVLAFGSDWTVAPLNPLLTVKAAVTRQTLDGKHPDGWFPEEKLTVEEAISAYTTGSAYAEFTEKEKGTLSPGKLADLVLIDHDLFSVPPDQIDQAKVLLTVVNGRIVYGSGL